MTRQELNELRDRLYVLAETVKDVEQDLTDDEADDERRLLNVLLYAAKQATTWVQRPNVQCASEVAARQARRARRGKHYRRNAHSAAQLPLPRTADNAPYVKLHQNDSI